MSYICFPWNSRRFSKEASSNWRLDAALVQSDFSATTFGESIVYADTGEEQLEVTEAMVRRSAKAQTPALAAPQLLEWMRAPPRLRGTASEMVVFQRQRV